MTTRPLPLPGWAMRALAEERLMQWRWRLKVQPPEGSKLVGIYAPKLTAVFETPEGSDATALLPHMPGDVLWVQETWAQYPVELNPEPGDIWYKADGRSPPITRRPHHWRSPVTMPRWASRWTLTVESVRVERCRDVTEACAHANGITHREHGGDFAREGFRNYWNARHGPGAWERNDWCAVAVWKAKRENVDEDARS